MFVLRLQALKQFKIMNIFSFIKNHIIDYFMPSTLNN